MNYLWKIIKCLFYPLVVTIITILVAYFIGDTKSNVMLLLNGLITFGICFTILYIKSKKYPLQYKKVSWNIPLMGISLAICLNMLIIIYNKLFNLDNNISTNNIFIMTLLSGILGPIMEEYLFRGIVFHELKKFNSLKHSLIITSILFAFMHSNLIQMGYAFIIGIAIIKVYIKTHNFLDCLVFHISANTIISLTFNYMVLLPNYLLISLSIFFGLLFYYLFEFKKSS